MKKNDLLKGLPTDREWTDTEWKIALSRARAEVEKEKNEKRQERRETFNMIFPELKVVPVPWLIIGGLCILFGIFTLFI